MKCDAGCGDCCGFAPCDQAELRKIADYAKEHGITPLRQGRRCPWYQDGACAVHPVRPATCRLFGHSDQLVCSKGYNANVAPGMMDHVMRRITAETRARGAMTLTHRAAYSAEEADALLAEHGLRWATPLTVERGAPKSRRAPMENGDKQGGRS